MTGPEWLPPRPQLPEQPGWAEPPPAVAPVEYAGWGQRVGAALIDSLLISVPAVIVVLLLAPDAFSDDESEGAIMLNLLLAFLPLVYGGVTMRRPGAHNGQTLGKQLVGIRVVREDGAAIGFWWGAARELVKNILGTVTLLVNYLWPLWDRKNQALHDKLVHDTVQRAA